MLKLFFYHDSVINTFLLNLKTLSSSSIFLFLQGNISLTNIKKQVHSHYIQSSLEYLLHSCGPRKLRMSVLGSRSFHFSVWFQLGKLEHSKPGVHVLVFNPEKHLPKFQSTTWMHHTLLTTFCTSYSWLADHIPASWAKLHFKDQFALKSIYKLALSSYWAVLNLVESFS